MKLCYECYLKAKGDPLKWDTIYFDPKTRKVCEMCGTVGDYVRETIPIRIEVIATIDKKKKRKTSTDLNWFPECGKRDRPEHLWKKLGYGSVV